MEYFKEVVLLFLPDRCFQEYFINFNFFDAACLTITLSKALSVGIILGSLFVKLPQILKLLKSRSAEGLSLTSTLMDLLAITISLSYSYRSNFPVTTWLEALFLALQTVTIATLIIYLTTYNLFKCAGLLLSYAGLCVVLIGVLRMHVLWSLQIGNMPLLVCGKLVQAHVCYQRGNTGQLSAATVFLLLGGSAARVFTSVAETGDTMLVSIYIVSSLANSVLAAQLIYYWNVKDDTEGKGKKAGMKAVKKDHAEKKER